MVRTTSKFYNKGDKCSLVPLKYHSSSLSASAPFLDQSDLSIHLNSQSQVMRMRMAAVCCTLMAEVRVEPEWDLKDKLEGEIEWEMEQEVELERELERELKERTEELKRELRNELKREMELELDG